MKLRRLFIVGVLSSISGCATYTLVHSGTERTDIYEFSTPIEWNKRTANPSVWTLDGELLEFLVHVDGINDGHKIFTEMPSDAGRPFVSTMRPTEIVDLFVESFGPLWGARAIELQTISPSPFGEWQGFKFEFKFESSNGLRMRAMGHGAIIQERLYIIFFAGAADYYFEKYLPHVEQMILSVERY